MGGVAVGGGAAVEVTTGASSASDSFSASERLYQMLGSTWAGRLGTRENSLLPSSSTGNIQPLLSTLQTCPLRLYAKPSGNAALLAGEGEG